MEKWRVGMSIAGHPYEEMTILAVDQSTVSSGYAVFQYGTLAEYGVINVNDNFEIYDKIRANYDQFKALNDKWSPDFLVMEDFVARNKKGAISNGNVVGAIVLACRQCPVYKVGNTAWKKGILGKLPKTSEQQKDEVRETVNSLWRISLEPHQTDISDAIGILTYILQNPVKLPKLRYN